MLDALKQQRRLTVADLSAQLHITDAATRATVEALLEAGLVEARGSSTARSYMLSGKVYSQSGKEAGYVRQSDIDKIRYPELIMKLAAAETSLTEAHTQITWRICCTCIGSKRTGSWSSSSKTVASCLLVGAEVLTTRLRKRAGKG